MRRRQRLQRGAQPAPASTKWSKAPCARTHLARIQKLHLDSAVNFRSPNALTTLSSSALVRESTNKLRTSHHTRTLRLADSAQGGSRSGRLISSMQAHNSPANARVELIKALRSQAFGARRSFKNLHRVKHQYPHRVSRFTETHDAQFQISCHIRSISRFSVPQFLHGTCIAILGTGVLLALSGCAAVQVHLGMKAYLAKTPVAAIEASQPKGPGIAPGQKFPLLVVVTQPDGKKLHTEGAGKGKVMWRDLTLLRPW